MRTLCFQLSVALIAFASSANAQSCGSQGSSDQSQLPADQSSSSAAPAPDQQIQPEELQQQQTDAQQQQPPGG